MAGEESSEKLPEKSTATNQSPMKVKRPKDKKPKRALSAYNMFFQDERRRVQEERRAKFHDMCQNSATTDSLKAVEKMGFVNLARHVAAKWSALDDATKAHYQAVARREQIRKDEEQFKVDLGQDQSNLAKKHPTSQNEEANADSEEKLGHKTVVDNDHQQPMEMMVADDDNQFFYGGGTSSNDTMQSFSSDPSNWMMATGMLQNTANHIELPMTKSSQSVDATMTSIMAQGIGNDSHPPMEMTKAFLFDGSTNDTLQSFCIDNSNRVMAGMLQHATVNHTPDSTIPSISSIITPAAALEHALGCMPSFPTALPPESATSGSAEAQDLAHYNWTDRSSMLESLSTTTSGQESSSSLSQPQASLSRHRQSQSLEQLTYHMDEDEQEYLIACFSSSKNEPAPK